MNNIAVNPILLSIPESLESERLVIRAPKWGDGEGLNAAIQESAKELEPWMPWANPLPTVEQSEINLRQARLQYLERTDLRLVLALKGNGQIIGGSGLHRIDWKARKFEIGYWIQTAYSKQGYVTEAVNAITQFAMTELEANRIEIRCDARNENSANVARRCGFMLEGILRKEKCAVDGSSQDTMVFAKVRGVEF